MLFTLIVCSCDGDTDRHTKTTPARREKETPTIVVENVSVTTKIDDRSLQDKSQRQLRLIRNAIFARHGYIFKDEELDRYFRKFDWYKPLHENVNALLTEEDSFNLELIRKYESAAQDDAGILTKLNQSSRDRLANFQFPLTIQDIMNSLGAPDRMEIGGDEFSSIGQVYFWYFDDLNIKLVALGDRYDDKTDHDAGVRYLSIHKLNRFKATRYAGFMGVQLGWTKAETEKSLRQFTQLNKPFQISHSNQSIMLFSHLQEKGSDRFEQMVVTNGDIFYYFVFDGNDELCFIAQSDFNIITAG